MISCAAARCSSPEVSRQARRGVFRFAGILTSGHPRKLLPERSCGDRAVRFPLTPAVKPSLGSSHLRILFCLQRPRCFPHAAELPPPPASTPGDIQALEMQGHPRHLLPLSLPRILACIAVRSVSAESQQRQLIFPSGHGSQQCQVLLTLPKSFGNVGRDGK